MMSEFIKDKDISEYLLVESYIKSIEHRISYRFLYNKIIILEISEFSVCFISDIELRDDLFYEINIGSLNGSEDNVIIYINMKAIEKNTYIYNAEFIGLTNLEVNLLKFYSYMWRK